MMEEREGEAPAVAASYVDGGPNQNSAFYNDMSVKLAHFLATGHVTLIKSSSRGLHGRKASPIPLSAS